MLLNCFIFSLVTAFSFGPPSEYKSPEVPCLSDDFCGNIAKCIYYYRDSDGKLVKITPDNLSLNKISNNTEANYPAIVAYCRCPETRATLPDQNLCNYRRKEKHTALVLQIILFPLGAGTYYMGWYFWSTITMISGILAFVKPYFAYTSRNLHEYNNFLNMTSVLSIIMWFVFWLLGLILIIIKPIDNNGIKVK